MLQITETDNRPRLSFKLPRPRKPMTIANILKECQDILRNAPTPGIVWTYPAFDIRYFIG